MVDGKRTGAADGATNGEETIADGEGTADGDKGVISKIN